MKPVGRGIKLLLGVVVTLILLALIIPYFLNVDRYRPWIASEIEKSTGRKVFIGGLHARLFPRPAFVVDSFALGNPTGFPSSPLFSAETIRGNLAWGPLLHGDVALSSVTLLHPKVLLLTDERGRTNYDFSATEKPTAGAPVQRAPSPAQPAPSASGSSTGQFSLDRLEIQQAEIVMARIGGRERAPVPTATVTNFSATLDRVAPAALLKQWDATADLAGVQVTAPALAAPIQFRSGQLQLRHGSVDSNFEADLGRAGRVKGHLQQADVEKGAASFELSATSLDLDKLFATTGSVDPPAGPSSGSTSAPAPQSELVAQGKVIADRLRWGPYEASQVTASLRIFNDRMEASPVNMAVAGGSVRLTAALEERFQPEHLAASLEASQVDLARLLAVSPTAKGKMTGRADLALRLNGVLGPRLADTVAGTGNFSVHDGSFPGFNLGGSMNALAKVQQVLSLGTSGGGFGVDTRFSSIVGDLQVAQGRVASRRIHLDADAGTVDLAGSIGFDGSLDYRGQAVLAPSSSGSMTNPVDVLGRVLGGVAKQSVGRITIPFAVRGTVDHVRIEPGAGIPSFQTTSPKSANPTQLQPSSLLDLFKKPKP